MQCEINDLSSQGALRFSKELHEIVVDEPFNFYANFEWARPFGMLFTATAIKQFRKQYLEFPFRITTNSAKSAISYASHMAFFKSISDSITIGKEPGEATGSINYIPITKLDLGQIHREAIKNGPLIEMGDAIEKKSSMLAQILSRGKKEIHVLLTYLIREILRNIPEHAECETAWICGQYWNDHTAEIAILDEGIGIKASLQKNPVHRKYIETDEDALQCALRAGISQAFRPSQKNTSDDPWANSGFGLYMVSEICKELNGSFCLVSGDRYMWLQNGGESHLGETSFHGTAVKITISTDQLRNSQEIISRIAKQGERQAKTIRNAFQKASIPSKGLMDNL